MSGWWWLVTLGYHPQMFFDDPAVVGCIKGGQEFKYRELVYHNDRMDWRTNSNAP